MKISDKNFIDWESDVFGYGYGTGEQFTSKALINCMEVTKPKYDYIILEKQLGKTTKRFFKRQNDY